MEKPINFKNSKGDNLVGILNETSNKDWVLIMCHGFTSSKNTTNFVKLVGMLEQKEIASLRFDFWGHGESDGNFSDITISEAVDDILNAIKFVKELGYKNVGLLGSSFGGISSIMATSKTTDLSFLCLKSPVSNYWEVVEEGGKHTPEEMNDWKEKGFREYDSDGKILKLKYSFVEDFDNNKPYEVAKNIKIPTLIVHGDVDNDVPYSQSQKLVSVLPNAELVTVHGADHRYTGEGQADEMLNAFYNFILENIKYD